MHKSYILLLIFALASPCMARDYVTVVGSSAIYPFMTAIIERFYRDEHQPAPIVESTGTGGGIRAFCAGLSDNHPDIVVSARPMTRSEKEYCAKHDIPNLVEIELGLDASVLVTYDHPFSLTMHELQEALSQNIQLWSDINPNLPAEKIKIVGPPTSSGIYDTFNETVLKPAHLELRHDDAYTEVIGHERVVVKKLELNHKSLGLISYTFLSQLKMNLKAIPINGVTPNNTTILSGKYPLIRKSYLYIKTSRIPLVKSLPSFLCYILSNSVSGEHGYLTKYGFIPMPTKVHMEQQQKVKELIKTCHGEDVP